MAGINILEFLKSGKKEKKSGYTSRGVRDRVVREGNAITYYLWGHPIAELNDVYLVIRDCGWKTRLTKDRLNRCVLKALGLPYYIFQRKFEWYLYNFENDKTYDWYGEEVFDLDKMKIVREVPGLCGGWEGDFTARLEDVIREIFNSENYTKSSIYLRLKFCSFLRLFIKRRVYDIPCNPPIEIVLGDVKYLLRRAYENGHFVEVAKEIVKLFLEFELAACEPDCNPSGYEFCRLSCPLAGHEDCRASKAYVKLVRMLSELNAKS